MWGTDWTRAVGMLTYKQASRRFASPTGFPTATGHCSWARRSSGSITAPRQPPDGVRRWPTAASPAHNCDKMLIQLSPILGSSMKHPPERAQPVGQRGRPRLQDQRRLDLVKSTVPHGRNFREARPGSDLLGPNFLPHHDPMITSGPRAMTSAAVTTRSFADFPPARSANMSVPPAASINSDTHAMPEIIGSSHSSK